MGRLRILIVEDHETVRDGLRLLLETQSDMEVVGCVADGEAAIAAACALLPDVMVVDLSLPGISGLTVTRAVRTRSTGVAVVVLTRHTDEAYVKELLAAGALGYVLKQSASGELIRAVRAAAAGNRHLDAAIAPLRAVGASRGFGVAGPACVTDRELEVLRLAATGKSNKEVAIALAIAVKTVEVHKANAMRKLQLHDRAEMLRFAALKGWLRDF